VEAVVVTATHQ
jgi:hypothetical protein